MAKQTKSVLKSLVFSSLVCVFLTGCSITLGPVVERRAIIVKPGVPIEILEQAELEVHVLTEDDGEIEPFQQEVGGWITMPPEHWETIKKEIERLRKLVEKE